MFCPNCGKQVRVGANFCPKCGYDIGASNKVIPMSEFTLQTTHAPSMLYQLKLKQATSEGLGMNWYKFIIYVQCFLGGLSGLISGITQILGLQYGSRASLMYVNYPGLKSIDVLYGVSSIVLGILMVYARFVLKRFKASSIGIYLFLPLINAIAAILYILVASIVLHKSLFDSSSVSSGTIGLLVGSVILFIINYLYFGHRKHLFNEA